MNEKAMKATALAVVQFLKGRKLPLNSEAGTDYIYGIAAGLRAASLPELADAITDWPNQTDGELARTINRWNPEIELDSAREAARAALSAAWDPEGKCYVTDRWVSNDGYRWICPKTGRPASGPEFELASITLVGGPRHGVTVG